MRSFFCSFEVAGDQKCPEFGLGHSHRVWGPWTARAEARWSMPQERIGGERKGENINTLPKNEQDDISLNGFKNNMCLMCVLIFLRRMHTIFVRLTWNGLKSPGWPRVLPKPWKSWRMSPRRWNDVERVGVLICFLSNDLQPSSDVFLFASFVIFYVCWCCVLSESAFRLVLFPFFPVRMDADVSGGCFCGDCSWGLSKTTSWSKPIFR